MDSSATSFIWKGFDEAYSDNEADLIPSTERMIETKFKREYTVYRIGHFSSRIVELNEKFELPMNSILHLVDNFEHPMTTTDLPDVDSNIFIQREHYLKYIYHVTELNLDGPCKYTDKYIYRTAGLPSKLMKFKTTYKSKFKYITTLDALPKKREALILINHNPIFRVKMFGRWSFFRRTQLILTSIFNTCCKLTDLHKNQFIFIPWGSTYYDKAQFLKSRNKLDYVSVRHPEDMQYIFMMHLLNFLWDTATTSVLDQIPDETLSQIYLVPYLDDKYIFYNLKLLKDMNVRNMLYRRVCNQLNLLSMMSLTDVEDHPEYHTLIKETKLDAKEDPEKDESSAVVETPITKVIETPQEQATNAEVSETRADIVERAIAGIKKAITPKIAPVAGVVEPKVTPVSTEIVSPITPVTTIRKSGELVKRIAHVSSEANVTKIDTKLSDNDDFALDYIEDLETGTDKFIDNYDMSPAAKRHFKDVSRRYKKLTIGGQTIESLLKDNSDSSLSDNTLDEKQLGYIPDKSALKSSLDTFDRDYMQKTFKKHIAGTLTSFAKSGVYLTAIKEEKVVTDLHNYTSYKCQYTDIKGNKSTVSFKIPNVHSDGTVTIDGVTQIVKKQRCPLPIVKISDTVVSLASNYNKTRVVRNTNKAHSFFAYISSFLNDKDKSNAIIAYGNTRLNSPISYEYTAIAERYTSVRFYDIDAKKEYMFRFDYHNRAEHFGHSKDLLQELESEYGVYIGYNNDDYFFIDNSNYVYAVRKSGGEDTSYPYSSLIDIFKQSVKAEKRGSIKPLSEWITIRLLDLNMPVIFVLAYRYGLRNTLDYMGIPYTITEARSKVITGESVVGTESFSFNIDDMPRMIVGMEDYHDNHDTPEFKELRAEIHRIIAAIARAHPERMTKQEASRYLDKIIVSSGTTKVFTRQDLQRLARKYKVDTKDKTNLIHRTVAGITIAQSYGGVMRSLWQTNIDVGMADQSTASLITNEFLGYEIYNKDVCKEQILRCEELFCKECLDAFWLYIRSHEEGHSRTPATIVNKIIAAAKRGGYTAKDGTLDESEIYAESCANEAMKQYAKKLNIDVKEYSKGYIESYDDYDPKLDDVIVATEDYRRPVKPRLGSVTIYATINGNTGSFGTKTMAIRTVVAQVKLGQKAACARRITNLDGTTYQVQETNEVPRDLVDRLSSYLHCGKRKISKAKLELLSSDKQLDKKIVDIPRLTPSEYAKMVSKLNIPGNKVVPPKAGNESLEEMGLSEDKRYRPKPNDIHIRFADRVLHFNRYPLQQSLIVAGLANYDLTQYNLSEFEDKDVYFRILSSTGTSTNYLRGIDNFYDLFIDNVTYTVLKMMKEPTNLRDLLLRCAVLLSTTDHLPASSGLNHRIRGYEQFTAILCNELCRAFADTRGRTGASSKFSINPDAVYLHIIQNAAMLPAELGSPMENIKLKGGVTYAGIGGRTAESFVVNDRRFDDSDTGVIGEATVDNGKAGMMAVLSYNPNIKGTLGVVQPTENKDDIQPAQLWTNTALVFPCSTSDDSKRINFINIQSSHLVPVKHYDRCRVRTGYERIVAHSCSRIFAGIAEEDGVVSKIDPKAKLVEVTYKSGRKDVFTYGESYTEFQSFETTNHIEINVKLGERFKKDDVITYNTDYFHLDHDTKQVDFSIGALANVALLESDATTEDSCEISKRLSDKLTLYPTNQRKVTLSAKSLIYSCAKIGDHVVPTDNLMVFDENPTVVNTFGADADTLAMLADLNKSTPHAGHQGEIVKIDAYYGCPIDEMSPTLQAVVKDAIDEKVRRSKLASATDKADEYPISSVIAKGSKYKGVTFDEDTVMLVFHIKETIPHGTGDKLVFCNQLKCTCCGVFPRKVYTESGVEIDMVFSARAMNKRIVLSAPITGIASRILEKVEDDICKEWFGEERPGM